MKWSPVQTEADKKGYLIFAMSQGQTDVTTQPGPWGNAYSGFCAGCVVRWIALRYGHSDFPFDPKTKVLELPDWKTTRDQNIYEDSNAAFPDDLVPAFANYGLLLNKGRMTDKAQAATGAHLKNAGLGAEGCYYIALRRTGGGHAVAMQNCGSGKWRFFDANFGEFEAVTTAQTPTGFAGFIDWYMRETGYSGRYTAATKTVYVNPPPYVGATFDEIQRSLKKK